MNLCEASLLLVVTVAAVIHFMMVTYCITYITYHCSYIHVVDSGDLIWQ